MKTISVVVPTYKRPDMLRVALESLLNQRVKPTEILIGDDTPDSAPAKALVDELQATTDITLRYFHNSPALKQAGNVHRLIQEASSELLCLLHDDDWMLPNAFEDLLECFEKEPSIVAAYGCQQMASHEGEIDQAASERLNKFYNRTPEAEGIQEEPMVAAIVQQFPNNGWLVKTQAAKQAAYGSGLERFGNAIDFGFGVKLAQTKVGRFYFINKLTTVYRLSEESIARGNDSDSGYYSFRAVYEDSSIDKSHPQIKEWMRQRVKIAIIQALANGTRKQAKEWFWSKHHRGSILTLGGIKRFLKLYFYL